MYIKTFIKFYYNYFIMVVRRERGERSGILLNEVDLMILKVLSKNVDKVTILGLRDILKLSQISERVHVDRLVASKFITKVREEKKNKYILNITEQGKKVLEIYSKIDIKKLFETKKK
jgi:DNA-binding MarR family transcriptional regulator